MSSSKVGLPSVIVSLLLLQLRSGEKTQMVQLFVSESFFLLSLIRPTSK